MIRVRFGLRSLLLAVFLVSIAIWIGLRYVAVLRAEAHYLSSKSAFESDLIMQHEYLDALRATVVAECDLPWTDDVAAITRYVARLEKQRDYWNVVCGPGTGTNQLEAKWYLEEARSWAKKRRVGKPYPFKPIDIDDESTWSQSAAR